MAKNTSVPQDYTIIIPAGGLSTRYPGERPKFLWTHPIGHPMFNLCTYGITAPKAPRIILGVIEEHEKKFRFKRLVEEKYGVKVHVLKSSPSIVYMVYHIIEEMGIKGPVLVKDCDSSFAVELKGDNYICYDSLNSSYIIPGNKSYLKIDEFDNVLSIVEKEIVSPYFSVGGYGFADAQDLARTCRRYPDSEYVSHLITNMILYENQVFRAARVTNYEDWGTYEDWIRYVSQYRTYFVDLDGVLCESSSGFMEPLWGSTPGIQKNIDRLNRLCAGGKGYLVVTTSRPKSEMKETMKYIIKLGIKYDQVIFGLPHSRRVLINDHSVTNPYPAAIAVSIDRNQEDILI